MTQSLREKLEVIKENGGGYSDPTHRVIHKNAVDEVLDIIHQHQAAHGTRYNKLLDKVKRARQRIEAVYKDGNANLMYRIAMNGCLEILNDILASEGDASIRKDEAPDARTTHQQSGSSHI